MRRTDKGGMEFDIYDLFPFRVDERALIEQIGVEVRRRMLQADPRTLRDIAMFLLVLDQLPYFVNDVGVEFMIINRAERYRPYVSVAIEERLFTLSAGSSLIKRNDFGEDESTKFELEVGDGERDETNGEISPWLSKFCGAEGDIAVRIESDIRSDDDFEFAPKDRWERLEEYDVWRAETVDPSEDL